MNPKTQRQCKEPQAFQHLHNKGARRRRGKEQEIGNLFEKTMKENVSNLMKEIDMQDQEVQKVPNKMDAKRPTTRHIIIKMPKVKDKERILKVARVKQTVTQEEFP